MRFSSWVLCLAAVAAMTSASACTTDSVGPPPSPPEVPPPDASIQFDHAGTLTLAPRETTTVRVRVQPAGRYEISFFLVGDSLDASLSQSTIISDPDGQGSVALRGPNGATYFSIKASLADGPSDDLAVAVSDRGFGALNIQPLNPGPRNTELWVANVASGTTCEALVESLPAGPDEAPPPVSARPGEPLILQDVPVGPNLSVYVRGGFYMWGCADEPNLEAGDTIEVEVHVVNKPIDLNDAVLDVTLGFTPDAIEWAALLDDSKAMMAAAMLGGHADEPEALLAAMSAEAGDPSAFDEASSTGSWPVLTDAHLGGLGETIADTLGRFTDDGMSAEPTDIVGQLAAVDADAGYALFTLEQLGTVSPEESGVPAEYLMTLKADPDDTVRLGGGVYWLASRHLGIVAAKQAATEHPSLSGMGAILGHLIDCPTLSVSLAGYPGCDTSCLEQLCVQGLDRVWSEALDASPNAAQIGAVTLQASGAATFDEGAALTGFEGAWVGIVSNGLLDAKVEGVVSAQEAQLSPAQ